MTTLTFEWKPNPHCRTVGCESPATEYISSPSTTTGLVDEQGTFMPATDYRRVCTPCADTTPDLISRQPLRGAK